VLPGKTGKNMNAENRLIVALDIDDRKKCKEMIKILSPEVEIFKVGIAPFTDFGDDILNTISSAGKKVFLDLKFHDIPTTVRKAAFAAAKKGVFMMNFHCFGGAAMMTEAAVGAKEGARAAEKKTPILLGVTVLTSMDKRDLALIGMNTSVKEKVAELAKLAKQAGMDGVVASAEETQMIKEIFGKEFLVVTPGIRPAWAASADQKRVLTPLEAIANGSDYIVVGRPITQAEDPLEAARKVINEIR